MTAFSCRGTGSPPNNRKSLKPPETRPSGHAYEAQHSPGFRVRVSVDFRPRGWTVPRLSLAAVWQGVHMEKHKSPRRFRCPARKASLPRLPANSAVQAARPRPPTVTPRRVAAASRVFLKRQAIVIGPTPPGTGVMAAAISLTS